MRGFQPQSVRGVRPHHGQRGGAKGFVPRGFAGGGMVRGLGSGTSDDVQDVVPKGTYIMPADSTAAIGADALATAGRPRGFQPRGAGVPVNLSNGEYKLPPEQVHAIGAEVLEQAKNATHTPVVRGFVPGGAPQEPAPEPKHFFANGGLVDDEPRQRRTAFPTSVPSTSIYDRRSAASGAASVAPAATQPRGLPGFNRQAEQSVEADRQTARGFTPGYRPGLAVDARHQADDFDRTTVPTPAGRNLSYDFGTTEPSAAGAGRGAVNPPRASQGPGFTQELASVPRGLPSGMPEGVIMKTADANGRPVYSGQNVRGLAPMVDGTGREIAQGGTVNTIGGGGTGSSAYADRQVSAARAAALARGDTDAVAASYGQGPTAPRGFVVGAEGAYGIRRDPRIAAGDRAAAARVQLAFGQDPASRREAAALTEKRADRELQRAQIQQNANFEMARLGVQREGNYLQAQAKSGGTAPTGYRFKGDGTLEAIAGGPADIKAGELGAKRAAQQRGAIAQADRVIGMADKADGQVSGLSAGFFGNLAKGLPGSTARDLSSNLETIKANLGFAELQAMRDASPTGGALGAIAVQELVALQSTVASLDQGQSPEQLRANLQKIGQHYERWKELVELENGNAGAPAAPSSQQAAPVTVTTQAQWASLPTGTLYTAPDGSTRRKQ